MAKSCFRPATCFFVSANKCGMVKPANRMGHPKLMWYGMVLPWFPFTTQKLRAQEDTPKKDELGHSGAGRRGLLHGGHVLRGSS